MNGSISIFPHDTISGAGKFAGACRPLSLRFAALLFLFLLFSGGCSYSNRFDLPPIDMEKERATIVRDETKTGVLEAEERQEKRQEGTKIKEMTGQPEDRVNPAEQILGAGAPAKAPVPAAAGGAASEGILLNFDNADIFEVIQVIAGTLNLNYIIDPQVKGVVNIHSGTKIPNDQLFDVFKKILHINGLDIRSEGDYHYIYVAKQMGNERVGGTDKIGDLRDSSQFIIQVVPLAFLPSADVLKLVEPYLSTQGAIYDLPKQNTLLISDYESKVVDMLRIIGKIDISPMASLHMRLVRVDNAPLLDLRDEIMEIFTALKINSNEYEGVAVVPLERVNSLLLVSNSDRQVQNGVDWIRELDVVPTQDRDNIYIYNVRNSVASGLSELMNQLLTQEQPEDVRGAEKKSTTSSSSDPTRQTQQTQQQSKDKKQSSSAAKKSTSGSSKSTTGNKALSSLRFVGEPVVFADDDRNSILIRALPADYTRIVKMLERLDTMPRQVLVEVLVAEITLTNELEFGLEWFLTSNKYAFGTSFSAVGKSSTTDTTGTVTTSFPSGFSYSFTAGDVEGFLQALASRNNLSILSSPQILVLNNEKASVNVGSKVPIVTTVTENLTTTSQVDKTVQYKDTGVILEVTPQINHNGVILLEVSQTVSSAEENNTSDISSPIISKRELQTKLAVKDGQSILMGGLIDRNTGTMQSGVPYLMDIPILGNLFKYQQDSEDKRELIVLITPYVIESEDVLDQYARGFEEKMKQLRPELHKPMPESPRQSW
ncbi:MAG: type II secretion system secretin GspD [Deltaproteobacteria bacterium]|nr:type II secretion system secretin GspD [Deltaproteobacteria bacterium]